MAGQVHLLEQAKLRLEMNLEQLRKEHKKELSQRDEENEEIRCNTTKKVKGTAESVGSVFARSDRLRRFLNNVR